MWKLQRENLRDMGRHRKPTDSFYREIYDLMKNF